MVMLWRGNHRVMQGGTLAHVKADAAAETATPASSTPANLSQRLALDA
jgi:hypothetical protein